MKALLETDAGKRIWESLKSWFIVQQSHKLEQVLRVSKLLSTSAAEASMKEVKSMLDKAPKRLLSPPIVWTCLVHTLQSQTAGGVVTLGGIDEKPLWDAWQQCLADGSRDVGHIYVSTLKEGDKPYSMEKVSSWASEYDIKEALQLRLKSDKKNFTRLGELPNWCYQHCVALPSFINGQERSTWEEVARKGPEGVISTIATGMDEWIF